MSKRIVRNIYEVKRMEGRRDLACSIHDNPSNMKAVRMASIAAVVVVLEERVSALANNMRSANCNAK